MTSMIVWSHRRPQALSTGGGALALELEVALGPSYKKHRFGMEGVPSLKVDITAVHYHDCANWHSQDVKDVDIIHLAGGNVEKDRYRTFQIH